MIWKKKLTVVIMVMTLLTQFVFVSNGFAGPYDPNLTATANMRMGSLIYPALIINDFNTPEDVAEWNGGANTKAVNYATSILNGPNSVLEGQGCLEQIPEPVKVYAWRTIYRDFSTPLDLSDMNYLAFGANSWGWQEEGFFLKVRLYSGDDAYEGIARIQPNQWNSVFMDIKSWQKRNAITRMEVSFMHNFDLAGLQTGDPGYDSWDGRFQLDYISATNILDMDFALDGETEGFTAQGGSLASANSALIFTPEGLDPYIESPSFIQDLSMRNTLSAIIKNGTNADKVRIDWITEEDQVWNSLKSQTFDVAPDSSEYRTYDFNFSGNKGWAGMLKQFRIYPVSTGTLGGSMEIDRIRFKNVDQVIRDYKGSITDCWITDNSNIQISGMVKSEYLVQNPGAKLALFELATYENENKGLELRIPLLEKDAGENFTFDIPLEDGRQSRLYSKFAVALKNNAGEYSLVDSAKYITNPDKIAPEDYPYPKAKGKKGLQVQMVTDAEELGISHGAINVAYNMMLYRDGNVNPDNTLVYTVQGENFYFKKNYVESLDNQIKSLSDNDITVTLILIMYRELSQDTPNEYIIHPDSQEGGTVYAFNTKNSQGVKYYKAITSFLAERYTRVDQKYGRAVNFIVGNEIGQNKVWYNMGPKLVGEYVRDYARTLRLTDTIVRSHYKYGRVFISLDHFWDEELPGDSLWKYDNRTIVDLLTDHIRQEGDIPWNIAFHPYPENLFNPRFWNDRTAVNDFSTDRITFKNLHILVDYMKQPHYLFNGQQRHIILSEQGFHSMDNSPESQRIQAAAYAYAYYKVKFLDGIDAFILHRHVDHSLEGGLNLGLWTNKKGEVCSPGQQKAIYDVFKYIDTKRSLEVTDFAKGIIGIDSWSDVIPEFDPEKLIDRVIPKEGTAGLTLPGAMTDARTLSDFEKEGAGTDGWQEADNMQSVNRDTAEEGRKGGVLKGTVSPSEGTEYKGISKTFNTPLGFASKPYLYASVKVTGMAPAVLRSMVKIRAYSGDEVCEGTAFIEPGKWNVVALDLTKWGKKNHVTKIKLWAKAEDDSTWSKGNLYIDDIGQAGKAVISNLKVDMEKSGEIKAGASITLHIANFGSKPVDTTANIEGLNGVTVDKVSEAISLKPGREMEIPLIITGLDVPVLMKGQLKVSIDGVDYVFDITDVNIPPVIDGGNMMLLGDFELSTDGWKEGQNSAGVQNIPSGGGLGVPAAYQGSNMLDVSMAPVTGETWKSVVKQFSQPIDLSRFDVLRYAVNSWGGAPGSTGYKTFITLTSTSGQQLTQEYDCKDNSWVQIEMNIRDWPYRNSVKEIEIGHRAVNSNVNWAGHFFIDYVYALQTAYSMGDFEYGEEGWIAGENMGSVKAVLPGTPPFMPGTAQHGDQFLEAIPNAVLCTAPKTVTREFSTPVDLSFYDSIEYFISGWGGVPGASGYKTLLRLESESGDVFEQEFSIPSDTWNKVIVDISSWKSRNAVKKVEIGYRSNGGEIAWNGHFFIDYVCAK